MAVLALKQFLSGAQALKADVYEDRLRVLWDEKQNAIAPEKLVPFLSAQKGNAKLIPPSSLELKLCSCPLRAGLMPPDWRWGHF